jgi:hypothetical protein
VTRRLQLLDPESRSSRRRVWAVAGRIRDGLLRENKVVPAALGILALLIFAWLIAGALIGGLGGEEQQQASNQASLAQTEDSDSGDSETPAPGVDNRDADASYGGYEAPKDPFKLPESLRSKSSGEEGTNIARSGNQNDRNSGGRNGASSGGSRSSNSQGGDRNGGNGDNTEGFIEQRSPGEPGFQGAPGEGQGGAQGGAEQAGAGQGAGLFNSSGDLPMP